MPGAEPSMGAEVGGGPAPLRVRSAGARPLAARPAGRPDIWSFRRIRSTAPRRVRRGAGHPGARTPAVIRTGGSAAPFPARGECPGALRCAGWTPGGWPSSGSSVAPLRLTARGRRLVAALSVATGLSVAAVLVAGEFDRGTAGLALAGRSSVVVEGGDTLWSIAREVAPDRDVRAVVDAIEDANELHGTLLIPGQVLRLP